MLKGSEMIEITSAHNPIKWKRSLIGGLMSAVPAIILGGIIILSFELPENLVGILYIVFGGLIALIYSAIPNIIAAVLTNVVAWFLIGAVIADLISKKTIAVVYWAVVNALLIFTAFVLCTWCQ
jgi:hypothetical protein